MIHDARQALPQILEADICIAGGGPAGIVLALELAQAGRTVVLLEGGGSSGPGEGAPLYEGEVTGRPYPLAGSRLRWLGGSTNHWGGWVRPLDPVDFVDKPHFAVPAWPIAHASLERWYRKAADWCEVASAEYDPERAGLGDHPHLLAWPAQAEFVDRLFRFSPPTRFGTRYRERLEAHERVDCWLHLNLAQLQAADGHVREARARTLQGDECTVRARHFVLAMGGVENARFLLNQRHEPGNQSGFLGRCFMDHFGYRPGTLLAEADLDYRRFSFRDADVMPVLAPDPDLMRAHGLNNACLLAQPAERDEHLPAGFLAQPPFAENRSSRRSGAHYAIQMINEPTPDPDSRITLGDDTDALGLRRLVLDWRIPRADFERVFTLADHFARSVGLHGFGRFRWLRRTVPPEAQAPGVGLHHMGTTRMSADPRYGVVDPDCRVWGQENLHVAGSSVFPTAGFANPTLTIVALAARLASHLDQSLGEAV